MEEKLIKRFLKYVSIDTQSNEDSQTTPSTLKQFDLANILVEELKELGLKDVSLDDKCYLMATLPSNIPDERPVIGFIAHMDTSPDMPGENVNPQIIENYSGNAILLNKEKNLVLSPADFPELKDYIGQTLITTDGNTLLGADDKAGIAEIITAIEYLIQHPDIRHGIIKIGFTPDEEIGRGVDYFDVTKFGAEYAYTMDGGAIGELEFENFNAAGAKVFIQGKNIHPGYAKNKMINASLLAMEFESMLPGHEKPEYTQDYEGFYHLIKIEGGVENAMLQYIIRDHDKFKFAKRKEVFEKAIIFLNEKYGQGTFRLEMKDQYYNMKEMIEPVYHVVEKAIEAMKLAGIEPKVVPIRGGTDGARLSYMNLPCPNIFAGGLNFHGKYEYVAVESMMKAVEVIVNLVKLYASEHK
jgi:tripeptide aminopeptidase